MLGRNWWGNGGPMNNPTFFALVKIQKEVTVLTPLASLSWYWQENGESSDPQLPAQRVLDKWRRSTLSIQTCFCAPFGAWSLQPESSVDAREIDVVCLPHPEQQLSHFHTGRQVQPSLVTDENPWGAPDYGEWTMKRNHIGHRYKRSPLFLCSPPLFPFSPSLGNIYECGKLSFPWKHLSAWGFRCYSMQIVSTLSCLGKCSLNPSAYPFSVFFWRERQRKRWKYLPDNCFRCFTLLEWEMSPSRNVVGLWQSTSGYQGQHLEWGEGRS